MRRPSTLRERVAPRSVIAAWYRSNACKPKVRNLDLWFCAFTFHVSQKKYIEALQITVHYGRSGGVHVFDCQGNINKNVAALPPAQWYMPTIMQQIE
mmetsp:Transcript_135746/g.378225  ORF Transcript_135746/g.378225 Transcript_135746/m.378225 type:complete len:97 (+) Transcript_135746:640-930(+)